MNHRLRDKVIENKINLGELICPDLNSSPKSCF